MLEMQKTLKGKAMGIVLFVPVVQEREKEEDFCGAAWGFGFRRMLNWAPNFLLSQSAYWVTWARRLAPPKSTSQEGCAYM